MSTIAKAPSGAGQPKKTRRALLITLAELALVTAVGAVAALL